MHRETTVNEDGSKTIRTVGPKADPGQEGHQGNTMEERVIAQVAGLYFQFHSFHNILLKNELSFPRRRESSSFKFINAVPVFWIPD